MTDTMTKNDALAARRRQAELYMKEAEERRNVRHERMAKHGIKTLDEHVLPAYSKGEEIFNLVSHAAGAAFAVCALILFLWRSLTLGSVWGMFAGTIYSISMFIVYAVSSIYHGVTKPHDKKVMQVIDHCDIYLLIIGSYAPMMLTGLREYNAALAWSLFSVVTAVCAVGMVFTAIDFTKKAFKIISYAAYFVSGYTVVFAAKAIFAAYPPQFFWWLLGGGLIYTFGMIFYGLGHDKRWFHCIFHLFILAGSVVQFVGFFLYCI
jgi:hemolysin III